MLGHFKSWLARLLRPSVQAAASTSVTPTASASIDTGREIVWERQMLESIALAGLKEQRTARRWKIFFRLIWVGYLGVFLAWLTMDSFFWVGNETRHLSSRHTAVISLSGVIDSTGLGSAEHINAALQQAFADKNTQGVILRINSPGGSPVQASMIHDEIYRLREQAKKQGRDIKVYAVVEEMCASGGYYAAVAADKIFVNPASLVGSIGVLMEGFGVTGLMDKLGVERRLRTAGENKVMMDPFSPTNPKHEAYVQGLLNEIHQQFITVVKKGRGARLKPTSEIFSGLVWSGAKSIDLGLADGYGTVDSVARDVIKAEMLLDFTQEDNFAERITKRLGVRFGTSMRQSLGALFNAPTFQ